MIILVNEDSSEGNNILLIDTSRAETKEQKKYCRTLLAAAETGAEGTGEDSIKPDKSFSFGYPMGELSKLCVSPPQMVSAIVTLWVE